MRKIASCLLFVLLFGAAASAHAVGVEPLFNRIYYCSYTNYDGPANENGRSWFELRSRAGNLVYTYEHFEAPWGWDNQKMTWAWKSDVPSYLGSIWETTTYDGVQCKRTEVLYNAVVINFKQCNDGHTRSCTAF
jgi:hypothetical protein